MRRVAVKHHFLIAAWVLSGIAAGCAWDRSTDSGAQDPGWDLVRYEDGAQGQGTEIGVRPDGQLTLVDGRGNATFQRGLLAGEKLETLARIVDALPPHSYAPSTPLQSDAFVVTVERDGEERTYASDGADGSAPEALVALKALFAQIGAEAGDASRTRVIAFRVLEQGNDSAISVPLRSIVRDRDGLVRALGSHRPGRPSVLPGVDFARQTVVVEFLGRMPDGVSVTVDGVEETESGTLRVRFRRTVPGPGCPDSGSESSPFVLVAVESHQEDLLFATQTIESQCP